MKRSVAASTAFDLITEPSRRASGDVAIKRARAARTAEGTAGEARSMWQGEGETSPRVSCGQGGFEREKEREHLDP